MEKRKSGRVCDRNPLSAASDENDGLSIDELKEKRTHLEMLRRQIREGTYKPAIGEIAINLLRSGKTG